MIDLRSDTVTKPTPDMYKAIAEAELGDDVFGDDPVTIRLEELAAEKVGKEAAMLVPSGTMGNLTAVKVHTRAPQEIIVEEKSHVYNYEVGGMSAVAGVLPRPVKSNKGHIASETIQAAIRDAANVHYAPTSLLCVENTHNFHGGVYLTPTQMSEMYATAKARGLNVHLDGARIFNAAVAQGINVREMTRYCDSVQFCLSKGLASPIGSLVAGPRGFITEARRVRKMLGGGMRQAGIVAACGVVSLTRMVDRLAEDHANCRWMAERLVECSGVTLDMATVQTNLLFFRTAQPAAELITLWRSGGVLATPVGAQEIRFAFHKDVSRANTERVWEVVRSTFE
ncbi:MAG: hypothetical protein AUJ92_15165 [Armatimonadetes bacterium CG2_30_59_28]|nr:hypothetical protein [Armatimonadota bacterium]OIO92021.1 MAG: hypothetical protein AUJ92_15165 [Armatimonadetes bacterium CG2_30_59_28]PIU62572.1 MAG: low-specificity L-threonine aldolase [Armatimonadetes bacterium CG07_land_8_20_14_0_80_59_28]PIX39619.1 MAG: low-specificity L-threonine aldolase [Armatimonadetes bacterium CG_4_8_14_3_um_filter_58_9]PIY40771.1 MAG: low-specificity L-threonine aldolase [Armatimonadetes bacterium CG_4_10_14_3_um_filter_59_10]